VWTNRSRGWREVLEFREGTTTFAEPRAHILRGVLLVGRTLPADGKINRQIAEALVSSDKTVKRHLDNVFAKLGSHSQQPQQPFCFEPNCLQQWAERSILFRLGQMDRMGDDVNHFEARPADL
jgi:regulatory LuxR family protein